MTANQLALFDDDDPVAARRRREIAYAAYLLTLHWDEIRVAKLAAQPFCALCPRRATEVHHKHYATLGHEVLADLVALCSRCHRRHHGRGTRGTRGPGR